MSSLIVVESFRSEVLVFGISTALLAVYNITKALRRMYNLEATPIFKSLQRYGQTPIAVAEMIDQDLRVSHNESVIDSLRLTSSWLLHESFFELDIVKVNEIIWISQKDQLRYSSFNISPYIISIPTGKTSTLVVADHHGRRLVVDADAKEDVASQILAITRRVPWAVVGYTGELEKDYKKNRQRFVALVEERRNAHLSNAAQRDERTKKGATLGIQECPILRNESSTNYRRELSGMPSRTVVMRYPTRT